MAHWDYGDLDYYRSLLRGRVIQEVDFADADEGLSILLTNGNRIEIGFSGGYGAINFNGKNLSSSPEMEFPEIGDKVRASMNGEFWATGVLVETIDLFAQYGVRCDDSPDKVSYFILARKIKGVEDGMGSEGQEKGS